MKTESEETATAQRPCGDALPPLATKTEPRSHRPRAALHVEGWLAQSRAHHWPVLTRCPALTLVGWNCWTGRSHHTGHLSD
ncbi:hypothetical protein RRG08_032173 [Elysia crispata]|uniref:Uncharacterized protein n=1 Tax=Elysia crispata TaxID=231223 RepID=A0AAE1ABZ6_9GAST|nr:hypothetical protein RRG08_032173 [Elysia crispata]